MVSGMYTQVLPRSEAAKHPLLEMSLFEESREIMGAKFPRILEYYLEDTATYLEQAQHDLADNGAYMRLMVPLHTIKSSSRQLGALAIADIASAMEERVRAASSANAACPPELHAMLAQLRQQFENLKPVLNGHLAGMR